MKIFVLVATVFVLAGNVEVGRSMTSGLDSDRAFSPLHGCGDGDETCYFNQGKSVRNLNFGAKRLKRKVDEDLPDAADFGFHQKSFFRPKLMLQDPEQNSKLKLIQLHKKQPEVAVENDSGFRKYSDDKVAYPRQNDNGANFEPLDPAGTDVIKLLCPCFNV